jgi:hypothetical protein
MIPGQGSAYRQGGVQHWFLQWPYALLFPQTSRPTCKTCASVHMWWPTGALTSPPTRPTLAAR